MIDYSGVVEVEDYQAFKCGAELQAGQAGNTCETLIHVFWPTETRISLSGSVARGCRMKKPKRCLETEYGSIRSKQVFTDMEG